MVKSTKDPGVGPSSTSGPICAPQVLSQSIFARSQCPARGQLCPAQSSRNAAGPPSTPSEGPLVLLALSPSCSQLLFSLLSFPPIVFRVPRGPAQGGRQVSAGSGWRKGGVGAWGEGGMEKMCHSLKRRWLEKSRGKSEGKVMLEIDPGGSLLPRL